MGKSIYQKGNSLKFGGSLYEINVLHPLKISYVVSVGPNQKYFRNSSVHNVN
jgi:hypothetical protein